MVNLKFGAFIFAVCLLLTSCVCETTNGTNPCTIQDTTATCQSNENFKSLGDAASNITKLIVRSKELKRINKDDLAAFVNLEEIDLSNSGLEEVDENAFAALTKLHKINLAGNANLKIPKDAGFITSNTLTCLNLSNTIVEELYNTLAHLPELKDLDLSSTNVKDFTPLANLEHLSKLVVSKTNETKDLCNILPGKEIIEKDANETETPLDCKTEKDAKINLADSTTKKNPEKEVSVTTEAKLPEGITVPAKIEGAKLPEVTTVPAKPEAEKLPEVTTVPAKPEIQNLTEVTEAGKLPEVTTKKEILPEVRKALPKIEAEVPPAPKVAENPLVDENAAKEGNKTEDEPKEISPEKEAPEKEAKTEKSIHYTDINKVDNPEEKVAINLPHPGNDITDQSNTKNKENAKAEKKENKGELKIAKDVTGPSDDTPKVNLDASEDVLLPSTANTSQSNGVNIVLGIILCVMIVGAIGFGYKYWKNRRSGYTHANTHDHDDEDKELQTIVAHRTDPDQN